MQIPSDSAAAINKLVSAVSDHTYSFFTAVAAVGVLSMAILQTIKDLFPVRQWFQRFWVRSWLDEPPTRAGIQETPPPPGFDEAARGKHEEAERDLIQLATDGYESAFYDLPIEQLCGQMNAAAQAVLDNPRNHVALLLHLARNANPDDIAVVISPPEQIRDARANLGPAERSEFDRYVDARNRVTHHIQRAIDALQVSAGFRWKYLLQVSSIILSALIAGLAVFMFSAIEGVLSKLVATVAVAILGGFLAPVARDLVASLQQLRK